MAKILIKQIGEHKALYCDSDTGVAFVENGSTGNTHSCHPNIDSSGSVKGMKKLGYWKKDARIARAHGTIYNIDSLVVTDELDEIARLHCRCGGQH